MYAFIHIPKTGGTTVRSLLRRSFGPRHLDIRSPLHKRASKALISVQDLQKAQRIYPILEGICGHRVTPFNGLEEFHAGIQFFTFLRNPLQRMVSHFLGYQRKPFEQISPKDLELFCADPANRNVQTRWLCGKEDPGEAIQIMETKVGFIGLTEQFDASLVLLSQWLGCRRFIDGYIKKNTGKVKIVRNILEDPYFRSRIEEANFADIKVYRYAIEKIFSGQVESYGSGLKRDVESLILRNSNYTEPIEPVWGKIKRNLVYKPLLHLHMV